MSSMLSPAIDGAATPLISTIRSVGQTPRAGARSRGDATPAFRGKYCWSARGKYRVFNAAEYRFYRSNVAPPAEGSVPFATAAALPATPAIAFADGTWYLSVSYFNGVLDSGFLPLGEHGETYLVLEVSGGEAVNNPPLGPLDWRLDLAAGGVIRVLGCLFPPASLAPSQWAIRYTSDGSDPVADNPTLTPAIPSGGLAILEYALPAQPHGTTVKVRLQTRRNDGTDLVPAWVYSRDSIILSAIADASGPAAPAAAETWPGPLPEDL